MFLGLEQLIEISVNRLIYNRKTIIDLKFQKSVTFNGCSVHLFNLNSNVIASCDVLFRPKVHCRKQKMSINCCNEVIKMLYSAG